MEDEELKQIPFSFAPQNSMGNTDFMVTNCNREAFEMIGQWPFWPENGLVIYGPEGCGKTHLAHILADKAKSTLKDNGKISIIKAAQIKMRHVDRLASENKHLIVENLSAKADNEALFHLFNIFHNETGRTILWTSLTAPNHMRFALKDLQSRLNMLPCVAIKAPDDQMLRMLIVKLFNDRQLRISEDILDYIIYHTERSFSFVCKLVETIDAVSLAYQMSVNYFVVQKALSILKEQEDKQQDLFDEW